MHPIHQVMSFRNRFRRGNALRPVNRIKHVIDLQSGINLNVQQENTIAKGVDNPVLSNSTDCAIGSTINGIYLRVEAYATTAGALANIYMIVFKNPGNNLTMPNANVVGNSDNKKYIIHQEMVMMEQSVNGNPRTLFNGVIVIPRGYRRMGPDDTIKMATFAPGVNTSVCFQCHYKEFR